MAAAKESEARIRLLKAEIREQIGELLARLLPDVEA